MEHQKQWVFANMCVLTFPTALEPQTTSVSTAAASCSNAVAFSVPAMLWLPATLCWSIVYTRAVRWLGFAASY